MFFFFLSRNPWVTKRPWKLHHRSPEFMSVAGTSGREMTLFPSSPASVGPGCKQRVAGGVLWEFLQESLLMYSLWYLFFYSFLNPTIGRELGPWEIKLQKWHLGQKPMWGIWFLTVQGTFHRTICILVVMLLWTDQVSYFTYIMYSSLLWPT